jgi:N-methylhydantoinase A
MKGGEEPTVCDANVVLGYLPSDVQLGGKMAIDKAAAVKAVKKVSDAMEISVEDAAEGIVRIANEAMFGALRLVSVEQGFDPRDFALVGFGGAGPLHANALGILTGSWPTIIPPGPGVLCAYGDATTVVKDEASKTYVTLIKDTNQESLAELFNELTDKASSTLIADGISKDSLEVTLQADVRYTGQAFQLSIECTQADFEANGLELLVKRFDEEHTQLFTFALDDGHEIVMVRAIVSAASTALPQSKQLSGTTELSDCKIADTKIYHQGQYHDAAIYERSKMGVGLKIPGPCIVGEMDSTTVILPGYIATVDQVGNLLINPVSK